MVSATTTTVLVPWAWAAGFTPWGKLGLRLLIPLTPLSGAGSGVARPASPAMVALPCRVDQGEPGVTTAGRGSRSPGSTRESVGLPSETEDPAPLGMPGVAWAGLCIFLSKEPGAPWGRLGLTPETVPCRVPWLWARSAWALRTFSSRSRICLSRVGEADEGMGATVCGSSLVSRTTRSMRLKYQTAKPMRQAMKRLARTPIQGLWRLGLAALSGV